MSTIFGQLEMLQELAVQAGDAALAQDLSTAFASTLVRYCDRKRVDLAAAIDNTFDDMRPLRTGSAN